MPLFYYLQFPVSRAGIEFIIHVGKYGPAPLARTENRSTHLDQMLWAGLLSQSCFSPLVLFLYKFSEHFDLNMKIQVFYDATPCL
jgi:hypothetical protein